MAKQTANPFQAGSVLSRIFAVLHRAQAPLDARTIAERTRQPIKRVKLLLAATRNIHHNSRLQRAGFKVDKQLTGYVLNRCRPNPKAKRPAAQQK